MKKPFYFSKDEITRGILLVGAQGTGKTTFDYNLQAQLLDHDVPFLIIEREKTDYRHWIRIDKRVDVIRSRCLRLGFLRPPCPEIDDDEWLNALTDMLAENFSLMDASRGYIYDAMKDLQRQNMASDEKKYFTPLDMENHFKFKIANKKYFGKERDYLSVCFNRLKDINNSIGHVFNNVNKGFLEELLTRNCVLELTGLGVHAADFLTDFILTWISKYRQAKYQRGGLLHAIFLDEAKRSFDVNKEKGKIPIIDVLTDAFREKGEALVVSDQESSKLSNSIKASSSKIIFRLGHWRDVEDTGRCIGATEEQKKAIYSLPDYYAVVKKADGSKPVLCKLCPFPVEKNVTDREVNEVMAPRIEELMKKVIPIDYIKVKPIQEQKVNEKLDFKYLRWLFDIENQRFVSVNRRREKLGLTTNAVNEIRKHLQDKGYVITHRVNLRQGRGRPFEFDDLTEMFYEEFDTEKNRKGQGRGHFVHQLHVHIVKEFYSRKGLPIKVEVLAGNGHLIDLVVSNNTAIEIETGSSSFVDNVKKILRAGFEEIIVVHPVEKDVSEFIREKILKGIDKEDERKIIFRPISYYYDATSSE